MRDCNHKILEMYKSDSIVSLIVLSLLKLTNCYDYYLFASIWSGSSCYLQQCWNNQTQDLSPNFFNIHGLWPNNWEGYPSWCDNNTEYNSNYIEPALYAEMGKFWNGMNWTTDAFHAHEWSKHGTCWNDPAGYNDEDPQKQDDFFFRVMTLAGEIDIYKVLANNEVFPSFSPYPIDAFTQSFNSSWGNSSYLLNCEMDTQGSQYLFSVYICIDLEYQIMDCPDNVATSFNDLCPWNSTVYYLPVQAQHKKNALYTYD